MTDPPPIHPAAPPTIIDLDLDPFQPPSLNRFRKLFFILPLIAGISFWQISTTRFSMEWLFAGMLALAFATFGVVLLLRRRRSAQIRSRIAAAAPTGIAEAVEIARSTAGLYSVSAFCGDIAAASVAAGLAGSTARLGPKSSRPPVEPIAFQFEPRLLSQFDAGFQSLNDANVAFASQRSTPPTAPLTSSADRRRANLKRTLPGLIFLTVFLGFALYLQFRVGGLGYAGLLLFAIPALLFWRWLAGGLLTTREWLLVPAALIRRSRHWRRPGWKLRIFNRRESVLLACITTGPNTMCFVSVADAGGAEHFFATPWELELLLRAWFSPLDPPRIDQLSDLN